MFLLLKAETIEDFLSERIDGELGIGSKWMILDDYVFLRTGFKGSFFDNSTLCYCLVCLL